MGLAKRNMKINEDIREFQVHQGRGIIKFLSLIFFNPCFKSVFFYRIGHFLGKIHFSFFSKLIWYHCRTRYGIDIDWRANLSGGLYIVHGIGTVIGKDVISKDKLTIYQGVTIGGNQGRIRSCDLGTISMPVIGDNCVIYTGACLFGPIFISPNTIIKAGSIISQDI
jgi:serine O-acetyltransferase